MLVFGGKGEMSYHVDSGRGPGWVHWWAKTFFKINGCFSRLGDDHMEAFSISHPSLWCYSLVGPAFLGKSDGGWGAPHSAGALTAVGVGEDCLTSHDIASPELMAAALQQLNSLNLIQRYSPEAR